MNTTITLIQHAVYATTHDHKRVRVTAPTDWFDAIDQWDVLDRARRDGRTPHVKFYEVRESTDPGYADAPAKPMYGTPTAKVYRGFAKPEAAARVAWKAYAGEPFGTFQGNGGWFYTTDGHTVAQGLHDLARHCTNTGLIAKGGNGKWFPLPKAAKLDKPVAV